MYCAKEQVALIAKNLGVTDQEVVDMNRRLGGDSSLNAPIHDEGEAREWQDFLVDTGAFFSVAPPAKFSQS